MTTHTDAPADDLVERLTDDADWLRGFPTRSIIDNKLSGVDGRGLDATESLLREAAARIRSQEAQMDVLNHRLETARHSRSEHNRQYGELRAQRDEAVGLIQELADEKSPFDGTGAPLHVRIAKDLTRRIELAAAFLDSLKEKDHE